MTGDVRLIHGDALDVLRSDVLGYPHALGYNPPRIPDASVDAVVTDPPYGLEFMGREWDSFGDVRQPGDPTFVTADNPYGRSKVRHGATAAYGSGSQAMRAFGAWCEEWAAECLRVLKPGGWLLAFGGTRTVHRLTCGIEDAGFEIRDGIDWLYGSGFPKSLDVSKAIDKAAGATREAVGAGRSGGGRTAMNDAPGNGRQCDYLAGDYDRTAPATDDARRWSGWGTALKPAREPIVVARKPLAGTVAANVLEHGTGALNIDACRVGTDSTRRTQRGATRAWEGGAFSGNRVNGSDGGRWPSNVVLSHAPLLDDQGEPVGDACAGGCVPGCPVAELDAQSGTSKSSGGAGARSGRLGYHGGVDGANLGGNAGGLGDVGGASRFFPTFRYQAKAPARERPKVDGVAHPTVKPLGLMRWLVRLVCPPGGTVLDLFAGSGTTGEACAVEGFPCVLIEREAGYLPHIGVRLARSAQPALL